MPLPRNKLISPDAPFANTSSTVFLNPFCITLFPKLMRLPPKSCKIARRFRISDCDFAEFVVIAGPPRTSKSRSR